MIKIITMTTTTSIVRAIPPLFNDFSFKITFLRHEDRYIKLATMCALIFSVEEFFIAGKKRAGWIGSVSVFSDL